MGLKTSALEMRKVGRAIALLAVEAAFLAALVLAAQRWTGMSTVKDMARPSRAKMIDARKEAGMGPCGFG